MRERKIVEFRAAEEDMVIEGYALKFDSPATYYGITEVIAQGALEGTDMRDVPLRYNHEESHLILARTRNKSLELLVDEIGLKIKAKLLDTTQNRDIYTSIKAGLIDKMSFAFTTEDEDFDESTKTRTIRKIDRLWDVSVVDVPYYEDTEVYARKYDTTEEYARDKRRELLLKELKKEELLKKL